MSPVCTEKYTKFNTWRHDQNGKHYANNDFQGIFDKLKMSFWLKSHLSQFLIVSKSAMVQVMALVLKTWESVIWTSNNMNLQ